MTDLVFLANDTPLTTSRIVADKFDKRHDNVMRDIRFLVEEMRGLLNFEDTPEDALNFEDISTMYNLESYSDAYGREKPMYTMNRDGFALLAMGFTGTKALQFKLRFLAEFNRMERELRELPKPAPLPVIAHVERPLENITDFQRGVVLGKLAAHAQDPYMKKKLIAEAANLIHRDEVFPVTDEERWPF